MQVLTLLVLSLLLAASSGNIELCGKCECSKETLIQPLYTVACSHLNLQDTFPDLEQWPNYALQKGTHMAVNFDWNGITHLQRFPNIPGIVSLSLKHNNMVKIVGSAFVELDNLKALDLSYNQLTAEGVQADVFQGRYSPHHYSPLGIVVLNLGSNQIHALSQHSFEHLPNLTELRLNNNPLKTLSPATLMSLASPDSLQILDLAYTGLSDVSEEFTQLPSVRHKLQLLYLNGNQFSHVPQTLAALGDSLQKLNLNDNPIQELDEDSFRGFLVLRELNISAMSHLRRIGPSTFRHLRSLEVLFCSYNRNLTELDEEAFGFGDNPWTLRELYLQSNALHALPATLAPWKNLGIVDVQDNPWRCDCTLDWFITDLLPLMEDATPDLVLGLHCSEPLQLSGMSFLSLRNSVNSSSLCDDIVKSPSETNKGRSAGLYPALQLVIIILLISIAGLAILYLLRLRRNATHGTITQIMSNIPYMRVPGDSFNRDKGAGARS